MEVIKWTSDFYSSLPDGVNKLVLYGLTMHEVNGFSVKMGF